MHALPVVVLALVGLAGLPATAKSWRGIEPGISTRKDVVTAFGAPSQAKVASGREVLAYLGDKTLPGTRQAQFKIHPETQQVERIDVFVGPQIGLEEIEKRYGPECAPQADGTTPCYVLKASRVARTYLVYPMLGLAVFFRADGKTVESLVFQPAKQPAPP